MQVVLLAFVFALQLLAAGCANAGGEAPRIMGSQPVGGSGAARHAKVADSDADGLCDATELRIRTNPDAADTDGDGFPDVVELLSEYRATEPTSPGIDQVGYLVGRPGHVLDLELRTTIEGSGQGATGEFIARTAWDIHGLSADDYFVSAVAVSATPPDNVRGISEAGERFMSVLGRTRLTFRLHFEFTNEIELDCAPALPFRYMIKGDDGWYLASRDYLLVVTPGEAPMSPEDYCKPVACL